MEAPSKTKLKVALQELSARRLKHEQIISNLLKDQMISIQQTNYFAANHCEIDNCEIASCEITNRSLQSKTSNLSRQVNLLAHLKEDFENSHQLSQIQNNLLLESILNHFGNKEVMISPGYDKGKHGILFSEGAIDFELIAEHLQIQDAWEDVFIQQPTGYFVKVLKEGTYEQICLSLRPMCQQEMSLILFNQGDEKPIKIGYLLLYRTLNYLKTGCITKVLQSLFGYPFKTYNIHKTHEYLSLLKKAEEINENFLLFAQSRRNGRTVSLPLNQFLSLHESMKLQKYAKISIINTNSLCMKNITVMHCRNHHSVIDIETEQQGFYQLTPFAISSDFSFHSQIFFRLCLFDTEQNLIHYQPNFLINREHVILHLMAQKQYKLYISCISQRSQCRFSACIQSQKSLQNFQMSLKFNKSYNKMTQNLILKYFQRVGLDEVERQMIRLSELNPEKQILIVRTELLFMKLYTDFISVGNQVIKNLAIEYEGEEVLCDLQYRSNRKKITTEASKIKIYEVHLSKNANILSCSGLDFCFSRITL